MSTNEDPIVQIIPSASDVDGDLLTYSIVTGPSKGTTSLSGTIVNYSPNADLNGNDSFTFKVRDALKFAGHCSLIMLLYEGKDFPHVL